MERLLCFLCCLIFILGAGKVCAVEVYYTPREVKTENKISGNFFTEISYQKIGGKDEASSYRDGWDYLSQLSLNINGPMFLGYNYEGEIVLRKTDTNIIEPRRDLRIKRADIRLYNKENLFILGEYYQDFSRFSLSNSLEGLYAGLSPRTDIRLKAVAGRSQSADTVSADYQRNVFGFSVDYNPLHPILSMDRFDVSFSMVTSQDDSSSCGVSGAKDLNNTVVALSATMGKKKLGMNYDMAYSAYTEDEDTDNDIDWGWALRIEPYWFIDKANIRMRYLFDYVTPDFYTAQGSAASDKIRHGISFDWIISDNLSMIFSEDLSYDHLKGSDKTKRTTQKEHSLTLNIDEPDAYRGSVYFDYIGTDSDDTANTEEAEDISFGFEYSRIIDKTSSLRLGYERRLYSRESDKSLSEYSHKLTLGFTKNGKWFGREYYINPDINLNMHSPKTDNNKDISVTFSMSASYNFTDRINIRTGINIADTNGAAVDSDYIKKISYMEYDCMLSKKKSSHLIIRVERNTNEYGNSSLNYKETRYICRFQTGF